MERAIPARWLPSVSGTGRDHREGKAEAAAACLADPVSGLIDGDPGPDQEAIHQERDWDASMDLPPTNNDRADAELFVALEYLMLSSFRSGHQVRLDAHHCWRRITDEVRPQMLDVCDCEPCGAAS
ncbi:hypothetical protein AWN88_00605 [Agrobacterium tumefaciens]|nr:hypothetical protein AWN88_00605 [Agrobacterium tumefaciens]